MNKKNNYKWLNILLNELKKTFKIFKKWTSVQFMLPSRTTMRSAEKALVLKEMDIWNWFNE